MPGLILAIDQGTTNTKALLVARDGQPVFRASTSLPLCTHHPGFVEQDPMMLWGSVVEVIAKCMALVVGIYEVPPVKRTNRFH